MAKWRLIRADEIELRTGLTTKDGTKQTLLLYKDARCDMDRLDEEFGEYGWQRLHKDVHGVSYCGVALRDPETKEWIEKWDAGEKSKSSPEKGEASDSFKRACVNWGIGRELYTAPSIWVAAAYDARSLYVSAIDYNDSREIITLEIRDRKTNAVVYTMGKTAPAAPITPKGGVIYPAKEEAPKTQEKPDDDEFLALMADIESVETSDNLIALMKSDRVQKSPYVAAILHAGHNFAKKKGWE